VPEEESATPSVEPAIPAASLELTPAA
jgi:hypothetical protein